LTRIFALIGANQSLGGSSDVRRQLVGNLDDVFGAKISLGIGNVLLSGKGCSR